LNRSGIALKSLPDSLFQHLAESYHCGMDTRLLELLVCPVTKGPLEFDREKQELTSRSARLAYPVRDGIPILLEAEARTLSDEELGL
jgi:uncharacterized protein YbaR (Trm112 family)